jgi:hypothetical protein
MRHNTATSFLNGTATTLRIYLFRATDLGDVLDHLLIAIVDPQLFRLPFVKHLTKATSMSEPRKHLRFSSFAS